MNSRRCYLFTLFLAVVALMAAGCSSGSSNSASTSSGSSTTPTGTVSMMVSDSPATDWAIIGVKILSISLNPQGGGAPVNVFTSPTGMSINLVQLDQLSEILGNASVPPGTYTSASVTLSANSGDVTLVASEDPDPGFAGTPGQQVPAAQIQIQGASGSAGSMTVPVNVSFVSPLVVTANQNNTLDLEFDLSHPAFLVAHVPPGSAAVEWAVNFNGRVRHHPIADITRLVLRDLYGNVNTVSSDNTAINVTKVYPVEPPTNPETAIASTRVLPILADSANGTIFNDLDTKTHTTIMNFSSVASSLPGKYVRVAARYQVDGTLVGVRIWVSSSFDKIWSNPEGHVLHVDTTNSLLTVANENGGHVRLQVTSGTQFYFRTPGNAQTDDNIIGQGTAFLANIFRGFKVHVKVVDPLASPLQADTVDIEIARFDGAISAPTTTQFTYTRTFNTASDNYTFNAPYISSNTQNGGVTGFRWWNFAFPTIIDSGTGAVSDFLNTTNGAAANFGAPVGSLTPYGASYALWGDPAKPNGWAVPWAVLLPSPVPLGSVSAGFNGSTFSMIAPPLVGPNAVTVDVSTASGSATLVYQVDRTGGVVTISPQDVTTTAGFNNVEANLVSGKLVKVAGLPETNGHIKAYVIFYFTGNTMPAS